MIKFWVLRSVCMLAFFAAGFAQVYGQEDTSANQSGQFSVGGRLGGVLGFTGYSAGAESLLRPEFSYQNARVFVEPKINFNAALYCNFAITNRLSVQAELNFMIVQGYELMARRQERGQDSFDINYSSLDIPLLLRFNFLSPQRMFGIMAGPQISIPLGRLEVYDNRAEEYIDKLNIDSPVLFGFAAGLFGGFQAGPGRVVGDLRFIFDFNRLQAEGLYVSLRRAVALSVGYEISF